MWNTSSSRRSRSIKQLSAILAICFGFFIFIGGMSCSAAPTTGETNQTTMEILNATMAYIKANHPDAAVFLGNTGNFTKTGDIGKDVDGYTGVTYSGNGWTISIGHAVVPHYVYGIRADYGNGKIMWIGTSQNGQIKEESYTRSN